jgi:hypothetical protein
VCLGPAEVGHHAVTKILSDITTEVPYGLSRGMMIRVDDLAPFFRVEPGGDFG